MAFGAGFAKYKYLGEKKNGSPELRFNHGGHRHWVTEISWNKNEPWVMSSVSADETLQQVWKIAESVLCKDHNETILMPPLHAVIN
ncbi:WD40/YVTN repeat-like-containing domain containing protein [Parasponia andersonii]|uniref:WD40/YVTN repeat-like-containing domain containing protein n=1 Tax=Parasponia andersonii TaxID=3476 RepID=A0A2P5C9X4_PARAD|nr:WD40/YVTN repeat-like-containing domain containing protein [Parasponia andersonii]